MPDSLFVDEATAYFVKEKNTLTVDFDLWAVIMKSLTVKHIDAFTSKAFAGNMVHVVLLGRGLDGSTNRPARRQLLSLRSTQFQSLQQTPTHRVHIRALSKTVYRDRSHERLRKSEDPQHRAQQLARARTLTIAVGEVQPVIP